MKTFKKISSIILALCMAISLFSVPAHATTTAVDVKNAISFSGEITKVEGKLQVNFTIPEGLSSIRGIQFYLELPKGFNVKDVSTTLTGWQAYTGTLNVIVLECGDYCKSLEELLPDNASNTYNVATLGIAVNLEECSTYSEQTAKVIVQEVTAGVANNSYSDNTAVDVAIGVDVCDHVFTNYISNNDATCFADGTKTASCDKNCGKKNNIVDSGTKKTHIFNYAPKDDAKCGKNATEAAICEHGCGTIDVRDIPNTALQHSFTNYVSNNNATCSKNCTKTAKCDHGCGETDTKDIENSKNPNAHSFTNYISNNNASCTAMGTSTAYCDYGCGTPSTITNIPQLPHNYTNVKVTSPATLTKDGVTTGSCVCGATTVGTIRKIKSIKIADFAYTGKAAKKLSVTVKDAAGNVIDKANYTVKCSSKKIGKATATITFKGNYSGSKKVSFKIVPKKTSISSLKAGKKSLTVKYKKQTSGTGYEIQYSTSSKFKSAKTVKISKNKTVSKTIKKLKSKKTYYVRVRVVKSSYKSDWSAVKKVKVK